MTRTKAKAMDNESKGRRIKYTDKVKFEYPVREKPKSCYSNAAPPFPEATSAFQSVFH